MLGLKVLLWQGVGIEGIGLAGLLGLKALVLQAVGLKARGSLLKLSASWWEMLTSFLPVCQNHFTSRWGLAFSPFMHFYYPV